MSTTTNIEQVSAMIDKFRLDDNMVLYAYITNITYENFMQVFSTLCTSSSAGVFQRVPKTNVILYHYNNGSVKSKHVIGSDTVTVHQETQSELQTDTMTVTLKTCKQVQLPLNMSPSIVKIKEVWTFNLDTRYIYTMVKKATGNTKQHACNNDVTYYLQLELTHDKAYLNQNTNRNIATSFLSKVNDMLRIMHT